MHEGFMCLKLFGANYNQGVYSINNWNTVYVMVGTMAWDIYLVEKEVKMPDGIVQ